MEQNVERWLAKKLKAKAEAQRLTIVSSNNVTRYDMAGNEAVHRPPLQGRWQQGRRRKSCVVTTSQFRMAA